MSRFRSSALDIFRVSRRNRLREENKLKPSAKPTWQGDRGPGHTVMGEKITLRAALSSTYLASL